MTWIPTVIGAGTAAASALGLGKNNNGASRAALANANNQANTLGDVESWYGSKAATADKFATGERLDQQNAYTDLLDYYKTDPNNDTAYARDLARADDGLHANVARAQFSNLNDATRGGQVVPGSTPSGTTAGVNAYLSALDTLGTSANQINVANQRQANRVSNMRDAYGLTTGQYTQDSTEANVATGAKAGVAQNLMDYYARQAQQQQAQEQAQQQQELGLAGNIGGDIGKILAGTATPKVPTMPTGSTPSSGDALPFDVVGGRFISRQQWNNPYALTR